MEYPIFLTNKGKNVLRLLSSNLLQINSTILKVVPVQGVAVGGAYENGNVSRDLTQLTITNPIICANIVEDKPQIYNYLTSLIPGLCQSISGLWNYDTIYYSFPDENSVVTKVLGLGLGNCIQYSVSPVVKSGVQNLSYSLVSDTDNITVNVNSVSQIHWSTLNEGFSNSEETDLGPNYYLLGYNWENEFGIQQTNGANQFPFMGWGGVRIGNISPLGTQFIQDSLYNFPASELRVAKMYDSLGSIFAGQGVQYNSVLISANPNMTKTENLNMKKRNTYIRPTLKKLNVLSTLPFQQGVGSFDYQSNIVTYETNGAISSVFGLDNIPAEGAIPGRNCAFAGVALSDWWSRNIELSQVQKGSLTSNATRTMPANKTAHNAPFTSYSTIDNPAPWNTLFSYIGQTASSPSFTRSANTPILKEGVTTMVITGAIGLYRSQNNANRMFNSQIDYDAVYAELIAEGVDPGVAQEIVDSLKNLTMFVGQGPDQYYTTDEFWNANVENPNSFTNKTDYTTPIRPNPPYVIKGGRIVLYSGQRIKAGSYVYSTAQFLSNVIVPYFYPDSAKEIQFPYGERNVLIGDIYSKLQGNQGGVIVVVSEDGKPPPLIPSCCQPIGVVMETIEGFGTPTMSDGLPVYGFQTLNNNNRQTCNDRSMICNLQGRQILVKILPMYSDFNRSCASAIGLATVSAPYLQPITIQTNNTLSELNPLMVKIKTAYSIGSGIGTYYSRTTSRSFNQNWEANEMALTLSEFLVEASILDVFTLVDLIGYNKSDYMC